MASRSATDKLIGENPLPWNQLLTLERALLFLGVSVAFDGVTLHAPLNTSSAERRNSVREVANPSFGTKKRHVSQNPTKVLEAQMTKLVVEAKKHFGLFSQIGIDIISHTRIG